MKIVLEDEKILAEATFMKKKMYYNMRIKTIQRNTTNLVRVLKICKSLRRKKLESQIGKLTRKLQEVDREIEERQHISLSNKADFEPVFTYGPNLNLRSNPLDEVPTE